MYNSRTIKPHKGQLISMTFKTKVSTHSLTGVITAATKHHVLFRINNNDTEITLGYDKILSISKPEIPKLYN